MKLRLGINTGFALNRFPLPEEWMRIIGNDLDLRYIQLTADMLNPSMGETIVKDYISRINKLGAQYNVKVDSIMTGAFTRVNHFSHPDLAIRAYWISWFKKFIDIGVALGATNMSSHFGIMSYYDLRNPQRRAIVEAQTIDAWKELAEYAKEKGMQYLSWEPMSVAREYGQTIAETKRLQGLLTDSAIPIKLCLDVDHGDVASTNPQDTDPYQWLHHFACQAPLIHLKQSLRDKGGHWPFTAKYNAQGKIEPKKVIDTLQQAGCQESLLLLELSFREREPFDSTILDDVIASAQYWKKYISNPVA